jgi:hypothetical protein
MQSIVVSLSISHYMSMLNKPHECKTHETHVSLLHT